MKIICTTCAHYCTSCGNCGIFHIGVTGMNVAPCRYYKPNDKPGLPDELRTIIALIKFDDVPPMPLTGYMAHISTNATDHFHEPALFTYLPRGRAFAWEMVLKWDYIEPYSTTIQQEREVEE